MLPALMFHLLLLCRFHFLAVSFKSWKDRQFCLIFKIRPLKKSVSLLAYWYHASASLGESSHLSLFACLFSTCSLLLSWE